MANHKKNVVLVNRRSGTGGSERLAFLLARGLDRNEFRVSACALHGDGPMREEYEAAGISFYDLEKRSGIDLSLLPRLRRFLASQRAHIVHTHDLGLLNYCFFPVRSLPGVRLVHTDQVQLHVMLEAGDVRPRQARLLRRLLPRVDALVCAGENVRRSHLDEGLPSSKMCTIYNGVDISRFRSTRDPRDTRLALGLGPEDFVISCAANFRPQKDHATLLRAFRKILDKAPGAHLLLMGEGELLGQSRCLAAELKLGERTHFLGARLDVPDVMAASDVYALSSLYEGLPISVLEAMASGLPVVATDVVGTNEIIENGTNGLLVPPRDPDALASAILSVQQDRDVRGRLRADACEMVRTKFGLERIIEQYAALYRKVLSVP